MVFAHQHKTGNIIRHSSSTAREIVKEKCAFCDVMQHNSMTLGDNDMPGSDFNVSPVFYPPTYQFKSLSIILSYGRAPPVLNIRLG